MKTLIALILALSSLVALSQVRQELTPAEIYQKCSPSVVMVYCFTIDGALLKYGSGAVVSAAGLVYTNYHVIKDAAIVRIKYNGILFDNIQLAGADPYNDAAILTLPRGTEYSYINLTTGGGELKPGMQVYALGNPKGYEKSISSGVISSLRFDGTEAGIQHSAPISAGSSGSPLLNTSGELIGINSLTISTGQNLNFAIPAAVYTGMAVIDPADSNSSELLNNIIGLYGGELRMDYYKRAEVINEFCLLYTDKLAGLTFAGKMYKSSGETDSAIAVLSRAIELDPGNKVLYRLRAESFGIKSDTARALSDYSMSLQADTEYLHAYLSRADYYNFTLNNMDMAISDYRKVAAINPEYDYVYNNIADCKVKLNDLSGAASELTRCLLWKADGPELYVKRAEIYSTLGMLSEAVYDYTSALELAPQYNELYLSRGVLNSKLEYYDDAISDYNEYIKYFPNEPVSHNNLAYCYMDIGECELAEKHFKRALDISAYHTDSYLGLAILYHTQGRTKLVVQNMCRATEIKEELLNGMCGIAYMESNGWFWSDEHKDVMKKIFRLMGITDSKMETRRNINPRAQQERAADAEE